MSLYDLPLALEIFVVKSYALKNSSFSVDKKVVGSFFLNFSDSQLVSIQVVTGVDIIRTLCDNNSFDGQS